MAGKSIFALSVAVPVMIITEMNAGIALTDARPAIANDAAETEKSKWFVRIAAGSFTFK